MESSTTSMPPMSEREKALSEKLGGRLLLIWLLVLVAFIELLVIVHLAR